MRSSSTVDAAHASALERVSVITRLATGTRVAVVLLPLAAALAVGSWVASITLSWGRAFILWPLIWWSLVSAILAFSTYRIALIAMRPIPWNLRDKTFGRMQSIIGLRHIGGVATVIAGLAASIWVMVDGSTASAPVEIYWLLPVAAYLLSGSAPIEDRLRLAYKESQRRQKCSGLTIAQRTAYEYSFLMWLHYLTEDEEKRAAQIPLARVLDVLAHECTPELLPGTLQNWLERSFIAVAGGASTWQQQVTLLKAGQYVCLRSGVVGMATALSEHDRSLRLTESDKKNYREQLLMDIASLAPSISKKIPVTKLLTVRKHPCWPGAIDSILNDLSRLGLIEIIAETEILRERSLGSFGYTERIASEPEVYSTAVGTDICRRLVNAGSLEAAIEEQHQYLREARQRQLEEQRAEEKRHKRCIEATSLQRVDFESKFLLALHATTAGDTEKVTLADVWEHLDHECALELSGHALRVWHERRDISVASKLFLEHGRSSANTKFSLTAAGRDLCSLAILLGSMEKALNERSKGHRMEKHEYNIRDSQIVGVVGSGDAHVSENEFRQFVNATDRFPLDQLAQELARLRNELAERAALEDSPEYYVAIGEVSGAEVAARKGDRQGVWEHLARVGKWTLDIANQIGVSIAVEAIKAVFKAYNIPIS